MKHSYVFEFENIILKPLEWKDIEPLRVLRNREREYFMSQDEITPIAQEKWFEAYLQNNDDIMFKIVKKEEPDNFIGAIALYDIDWENKISECGRTVIDKELVKEKGIGGVATKAVCLFGFEILKLRKIVGEVLKSNLRILKVDMRAGFYVTGEDKEVYNIEMTRKSINIDRRKTIFDYKINEEASVKMIVTEETVDTLAAVSGDRNLLHMDENFAKEGPFGKRIVHGLFCIGLISNVIGNSMPGSGAVLLKQEFQYCHPVYIGDEIDARVRVSEIEWRRNRIKLDCNCTNQDGVNVLRGISLVKLF